MVLALADPILRPLPYADPDRLVSISFGLPDPRVRASQADVPSLASWRARTDLFVDVAAFIDQGWTRVQLSNGILPLRTVAATDNLLAVLGVQSQIDDPDTQGSWVSRRVARTLSGGELEPGRWAPIVPEGVLRVRTILPDSFLLPQANRKEPVDAILVLPVGPVAKVEGMAFSPVNLVARMRQGVTPQMVEAALNVNMAPVGRLVSAVPLSIALTSGLRGLARGALLASGLVVLVCWANVFSMALTGTLYRGHELATRTALGATSLRMLRLLGAEGLKIAAVGSASALGVGWLALRLALLVLPPTFATLGEPAVNTRVGLFTLFAGSTAGMSWYLASLLAWRVSQRRQPQNAISRDGDTIRTVRFVLIAGQLSAASVLLVGSALLGRSYLNLLSIDSGLDERAQTLTVIHNPNLPPSLRVDLVERTLNAFRKAGGVTAVGASGGDLLDGRTSYRGLVIDGKFAVLDWTFVAGDYFRAMGLQFLAGGPPGPRNGTAVVINVAAAREYFGDRMPVGELLAYPGDSPIVGVIADIRSRGLSLSPTAAAYVQDEGRVGAQSQTTYVIRVADRSLPIASWEHVVRDVDPLAVILDSGAVRERLDRSVRDRTFATLVIGLFALSSIIVAALGVAGVVGYTVVKRTREIAVRRALGATIEGVTTLVVRDALTAAACGVASGVIASVWLSRTLESLLYGIRPADPMTLALTAGIVLAVVIVAAVLPAMRAARISPAGALRIG